MVEILVEVVDGPARTRVAALAKSIRRAVYVTGAYYPGVCVRVVYPIDPEAFFPGLYRSGRFVRVRDAGEGSRLGHSSRPGRKRRYSYT